MLSIALSAGKGGVGKTALAFNLAHILSDGARVLAVDADPQASLTWAFGIESPSPTLADVLSAPNTRRAARDAAVAIGPPLALLPSSIALAGAEMALAAKIGRETLLRRALESLSGDYDIALIDSSPTLGLLAINALAACDGVLLPIIADGVSLHAIGTFLDTLDEVRASVNPNGAQLIGVVVTMFNEQLSHHAAGIESIGGAGLKVIAEIGRTVRIPESMAAHKPLREYDRHNPRNDELDELAKVIKRWQKQHNQSQPTL